MRTSAAALVLSLAIASGARGDAPPALPALPGVDANPAPAVIADFTLTDQRGKPRAFSSLRGQPVLVFFGFTHCPGVCPSAMGRLKLLHQARGGALKDARVVFVSVDGERDTPARLEEFLGPLSADFIGLTGDPKATRGIAARFAAVFFKEPAGQDGNYNVMHTAQVYAVDKSGRLRATFKDAASIEDMATVTALLLAEPAEAGAR
jgi:protein SCO1/2